MDEIAELHKERQTVAALLGLLPGDRIPVGGTVLQDLARALARRDWSVRVLDAVPGIATPTVRWSGTAFEVFVPEDFDPWARALGSGPTPDAARHAAALAVFPTLSEAKREELGECP